MRRRAPLVVGVVMATVLAVTMAACGNGATAPSTAVVTTLAGKAGATGSANGRGAAARFNNPKGIACDAAGNVYVADFQGCTIRKITPSGRVATLAGKSRSVGSADGKGAAARFNGPDDVACGADGSLYVPDMKNNTIRKITPDGEVTTLAGKAGSRSWGHADGSGAEASFRYPAGIACDAAGNLYVTDYGNATIRKITPDGEVTTLAGEAGSTGSTDGRGAAARFEGPVGIACDAAGNVYVADGDANTIRGITPDGQVTTLAGEADSEGSADGKGAAARFYHPAFVACDASGNVYVSDWRNATIRRITPAGEVTTLAGKVGVDAGRPRRRGALRLPHRSRVRSQRQPVRR